MEYGRNNSTWFNPQQLKDRWFLNDKQIVAYHALRRMDDFNHIILNSFEYSRKERLGFKTITLTNPKAIQNGLDKSFDARVIDTIDNPSNKSIYNVTTGRYEKDLSVSRLQELKQQGYILTELEGARETDVLEPLNFLIGKVQDITVKPLKYNQVDYRAGGRVAYQEEYCNSVKSLIVSELLESNASSISSSERLNNRFNFKLTSSLRIVSSSRCNARS